MSILQQIDDVMVYLNELAVNNTIAKALRYFMIYGAYTAYADCIDKLQDKDLNRMELYYILKTSFDEVGDILLER